MKVVIHIFSTVIVVEDINLVVVEEITLSVVNIGVPSVETVVIINENVTMIVVLEIESQDLSSTPLGETLNSFQG